MGYWNMMVQGEGPHHNPDYDRDADKLFREFVNNLRAAGHQIHAAVMTHGGAEDMLKDGRTVPQSNTMRLVPHLHPVPEVLDEG